MITFNTPAGAFIFQAYFLVTACAHWAEDATPFVVATFHSSDDAWKFVDSCKDGYSYDVILIDNIQEGN